MSNRTAEERCSCGICDSCKEAEERMFTNATVEFINSYTREHGYPPMAVAIFRGGHEWRPKR